MILRDLDFFDRQRDMFPRFLGLFDEDWKNMRFADSQQRFDRELDRLRRDLLRLDTGAQDLQVWRFTIIFFNAFLRLNFSFAVLHAVV